MKQTQEKNNTLKTKLQEMLENERETLKREVIDETLEYNSDEEIECFFSDLLQHGCVSGMVGKLIYYTDTYAFYDKHYDEIEELRVEYLENVGEALNVGDRDWKNTLAWFGFEETAYQLASELGIEV
ncbi:MAG: hypothetical protein GY730_06850 [bacterium]|nr:hypothetical protein [bacterium]